MASDRGHPDQGAGGAFHLLTPAAELAALREPTAGVDLMDRHQLNRYESESQRMLKKGFSHFLSPQLQALIKEKPRIALSEKADFGELLAEEPSASPWPIQKLSIDQLRRSFLIRKRVAVAGVSANADEGEEGPPVPPDVPMANQTTNKFSPAYAKKAKQAAKRPRPSSDDDEEGAGDAFSSASATPPNPDFKPTVKPLISKLVAMKWHGWRNPFMTVFNKSNAPPRYFEFIKRPMNLTYIRDNLNKNKYTSVAEVEADLELVVSNALTFNRPHDPVHQFALELQTAFRSELPQIKQTLEDLAQQRQQQQAAGGMSGGQVDKKPRVR
eukprot:g9096.t1